MMFKTPPYFLVGRWGGGGGRLPPFPPPTILVFSPSFTWLEFFFLLANTQHILHRVRSHPPTPKICQCIFSCPYSAQSSIHHKDHYQHVLTRMSIVSAFSLAHTQHILPFFIILALLHSAIAKGTTVVRHVTGNDKDYLRLIPRVVW